MTGRYLLLVDDEPNVLEALRRELHAWAAERSLTIETAANAGEALEKLKEIGHDTILIISDLKMPEMNGSEFLMRVKQEYPDIVSMLLTAYSETEDIAKAVRSGVFRYLLKPWDSAYLLGESTKAFSLAENRKKNRLYRKIIEEELRYAGEMQRAVLRPNLPTTDEIEFKASYRPLPDLGVGGDYYDVIHIGPGRYLLLIGDVAGHGVRAAIVTSILKAVIFPEFVRGLIGKSLSPSSFLSWLNERMNFELRSASDLLVTFFAGVLDMNTLTLTYANAGQTHPYLVRRGKATELLVSGRALGHARSVVYAEQQAALFPGDILALYTDGLVEWRSADGGEMIKIASILEQTENGPDYHRRIIEKALSESGRSEFSDDITLLTAKLP